MDGNLARLLTEYHRRKNERLRKALESETDSVSRYRLRRAIRLNDRAVNWDGGAGSGNWGHAGRPGNRGGSAQGGGVINRLSTPSGGYTSRSQAEAEDRKRTKAAKAGGGAPKVDPHIKEWADTAAEKRTIAADKRSDAMQGKGTWEDAIEARDEANIWTDRAEGAKNHPFHSDNFCGAVKLLDDGNVKSLEVKDLDKELSEDEIIERLAGADLTTGSCSSVAFSYMANKNGMDVLDFRGGQSRYNFACDDKIGEMTELLGGQTFKVDRGVAGAMDVLKNNVEEGKEYYFGAGRHAAIVRKKDGKCEYLEMQDPVKNGWKPFEYEEEYWGKTTMKQTLQRRFSCRVSVERVRMFGASKATVKQKIYLIDVDSAAGNKEFRELMGYINTEPGQQKKGAGGGIK